MKKVCVSFVYLRDSRLQIYQCEIGLCYRHSTTRCFAYYPFTMDCACWMRSQNSSDITRDIKSYLLKLQDYMASMGTPVCNLNHIQIDLRRDIESGFVTQDQYVSV